MTDYVLAGLVKRRSEVAGEAGAIRIRLLQLDADLVHLDAVIQQFDPGYSPVAVGVRRPQGPDVARRGERSRLLLDVLREAGEALPGAEIVRRMLLRLSQDAEDRKLVREFTKRVEAALGRQEKAGTVRARREPGQMVVWEVAR